MNFKKICKRIALVLLTALAACNRPQKAVHQAPPPLKRSDTPTNTSPRPDTDQVPAASKPPDTATKTDPRPDTDQVPAASKPAATTKSKARSYIDQVPPGSKPATTTTKNNARPDTDLQALTLPILDALFYEPDFAKELKAKLDLSNTKINQLRTAAHTSIRELNEDGSPDTASARAATENYKQRIRAVIGAARARQLFQLVNQRYSQGLEGLAPSRPNFVPKDTRIVVNAPAFRMDVFEKGQLLKTFKVGIGYPEFPLPVGMRRADTVIFNPSWTPPDEPWVHGRFAPGRKVSAVNRLNPLGIVKIPIGMPSLIHGGKPPRKIGHFASHGCVGLTNNQVLDLVPIILRLGQSDLSAKTILSLETHRRRTKAIKLAVPVPVDLRYETIVAENGGLRIYRDVYERGTNTLDDAKTILAAYNVKYEQLSAMERGDLQAALSEMNRDARGRQIAATDSIEPRKGPVPASKLARAKKGRVTSKVKGHSDILVKVTALQGKGYPAPASLDGRRAKKMGHKNSSTHHGRRSYHR